MATPALSSKTLRTAIYGKLTATRAITTLISRRVYHAIAPDEAGYPLVIFHKQSGTPVDTFGERAWINQVWLVKAVDRASSSTAAEDTQAAIIDTLTDDTLTVAGGTIFDLRYLSDIDYIEVENGVQYRHHGALFRVVVR